MSSMSMGIVNGDWYKLPPATPLVPKVTIPADDYARLLKENKRLSNRVKRLTKRNKEQSEQLKLYERSEYL